MKPFLKWPGGKRWLASEITKEIGQVEGKYIEPFLGGASVFFHLEPSSAILSDANTHLITTYKTMRTSPNQIVKHLKRYHRLHSKEFYYQERARKHTSDNMKAAQFLYLNRTCFNGIYRVNLRGEFNVPIGSKTNVVMSDDDFDATSKVLNKAAISCCDFEDSINKAVAGDVVFADPPYTVKHNMNGFIKYNENLFAWSDQVRLCEALERAVDRGARVFSTNANHQSLMEIYGSRWYKYEISRSSIIAGKSSARSKTTELLICSAPMQEPIPGVMIPIPDSVTEQMAQV